MSVTFDIVGIEWPRRTEGDEVFGFFEVADVPAEMFLNISNVNALDFFYWLRIPADEHSLSGKMSASELAALVRRAQLRERNGNQRDTGREASEYRGGARITHNTDGITYISFGPRAIYCGREPGRFEFYCQRLLALCKFAGDRIICWG